MAKPLWRQKTHREKVHARWVLRPSRPEDAPWSDEQCGRCTYWVPLTGTWGLDWGVCSNPASPMDRHATFEHDGCPAFVAAEKWSVPNEAGPDDA